MGEPQLSIPTQAGASAGCPLWPPNPQALRRLLAEAQGGGGQVAASCVLSLSLAPVLPLIPSHSGFTD